MSAAETKNPSRKSRPAHRPRKVTVDAVVKAIREAHGIPGVAAKRVGIARSTLHRMRNEFAEIDGAFAEARERTADVVEQAFTNAALSGKDWRASLAWLRTHARDRGYVERFEINDDGEVRRLREENAEMKRTHIQSIIDRGLPQLQAEHEENVRRWRDHQAMQ